MTLPETLCSLPWINLSLDVDGTTRPCCKFAHASADSAYQLGNMKDADLDAIWHGEAWQKLRRDFLNGVKPVECSTCWNEEAAGIKSYRQTFARYRDIDERLDHASLTPPGPRALDLKLSNVCNLKCRICGPVASSLWLNEELAVSPKAPSWLAENKSYYLSNKITEQPVNLEVLRRWLPHLDYVEMTGGETLLARENKEILQLIAEEGNPEKIGILFNTNVTIFDEDLIGHLARFKSVKICLSIDDIGRRIEYERAPCDWSSIEENLRAYSRIASRSCRLYAFCSVSFFNAWYLPEYVSWLTGSYDPKVVEFKLNLVHEPRHYCVQVMPRELKDSLRRRLQTGILDAAFPRAIKSQVEELVEFMDTGDSDPEAWAAGLRETESRDRIRDESFPDVFPELYAEMQRLKLVAPSPAS